MSAPSRTHNRPRALSDLMPGLTRGVFGRKNALFGKMVAEWAQVAGAEIAAHAVPLDLKFSKKNGNNQAVLHLSVLPARALELSYQKTLLVERLNMFFGYPAVKDIRFIQNSEVMNNKISSPPPLRPLTPEKTREIDALVAGIQENDLQTALKNLGKAIASRIETGKVTTK